MKVSMTLRIDLEVDDGVEVDFDELSLRFDDAIGGLTVDVPLRDGDEVEGSICFRDSEVDDD